MLWLASAEAWSVGLQSNRKQSREVAGAVHPYVWNSYFNGVFEFISHGKVRPVYLTDGERQPVDWNFALTKAAGAHAFFLFSAESIVTDRTGADDHAVAEFLSAAKTFGRVVEWHVLKSTDGRPVFWLYEVADAPPT